MAWRLLRSIIAPAALVLFTLSAQLFASGKSAGLDSAPVMVFTHSGPAGEASFAIAVSSWGLRSARAAHDHILLVDTSASQTGEYRTRTLAVVKGLLSELPDRDRVQLMSVDVFVDRLSKGFAALSSAEAHRALEKLENRAPLGATDLQLGIETAMSAAENGKPTSIVYIGDGMSAAGFIRKPEMRRLVAELRARKISVTSYAIGPTVDVALLAILAQQTGGVVLADAEQTQPDRAAHELAAASAGEVTFPVQIRVEPTTGLDFTSPDLPLRADRATLFFGSGRLPESLTVTVTGSDGDTVSYPVPSQSYRTAGAHLPLLARQSKTENGFVAAGAGLDLFRQVGGELDNHLAALAAEGDAAVASRNFETADGVARALAQLDPGNAKARALREAVTAARNVQPTNSATESDARNGSTEVPDGEQDDPDNIAAIIRRARRLAIADPETAISELKRAEAEIRDILSADPDLRRRLSHRLLAAMQSIRDQERVRDQHTVRHANAKTADIAQTQIVERMERHDERAAALILQCRALLTEGEQSDPEPDVLIEGPPGATPVLLRPTDAPENLIDTLRQVERSHVVSENESSILFPDAQSWRAMTQRRAKWAFHSDTIGGTAAEARLESALEQLTQFSFSDTPLTEAMRILANKHHVTVRIDSAKLAENSIAIDAPITRSLSGMRLRNALKVILEPMQLSYVIDDDAIRITTIDAAHETATTRRYYVRDLMKDHPHRANAALEVWLTGGSMGGLIGSRENPECDCYCPPTTIVVNAQRTTRPRKNYSDAPSPSFGERRFHDGRKSGSARGPAGSGDGASGEPKKKPNSADGNAGSSVRFVGQAFAQVRDDEAAKNAAKAKGSLQKGNRNPRSAPRDGETDSTPTEKPAADAAPKAEGKGPETVEMPSLDPSNGTPSEIWNEFVKTRKPSSAALSRLMTRLHDERKHEHVIAAIEAALKNGQSQPWMYDVLALTMELAGRPQADIERVLLSRVDFTTTEITSMMYSAAYLTRFGGKKQALKLYRQASQIQSTRPEPYVMGLPLAEDAKDYDAVRWAATGILTTAWGRDHEKLHTQAGDAAAEAIAALRKAGNEKEARAFENDMAEARKRDLVLKLVWSGDGDLDMSIVEPPGTVCSVNNPLSPGGGVHLRDGYGPDQKNCHEDYVCAFGVPGNYRIKVRHVGGNVVGKRAQLTIIRHQGSTEESSQTLSVPITNEESSVLVSLPNGRRTQLRAVDPKSEPDQSAHDRKPQAVLPEALPGKANSDVLKRFGASRARAAEVAGGRPGQIRAQAAAFNTPIAAQVGQGPAGGSAIPGMPLAGGAVGGGAVGYTPVVSNISEGVSMSALAVVSGDRRYVRLTIAPVFSAITDVFTFSFLNSPAPGGATGN
ncbi:MAG: hypothetical protein AB7O26_00940 [Planctomycetaceae bacterium]